MCKFVLTSKYSESAISGLFRVHLKTDDVTITSLLDELQYMKDASPSEVGQTLDRAPAIYTLLEDLVDTAENKQFLR